MPGCAGWLIGELPAVWQSLTGTILPGVPEVMPQSGLTALPSFVIFGLTCILP